MATRYNDISYGGFGDGVDALSPESKIQDGFVQELENIDPTPEGSLKKRTGTLLYGTVPVRVDRLEYFRKKDSSGNVVLDEGGIPIGELCYYLDPTADVLSLKAAPILAYGRTSESHALGDLTNVDRSVYYPSFITELRRQIPGNVTTDLTLEGTAHRQGLFQSPSVAISTSGGDLSNEQVLVDAYLINKDSEDFTASINLENLSSKEVFLTTKSRNVLPTINYIHTQNISASAVVNGELQEQVVEILQADHDLRNFSILLDCFQDTGTDYEKVFPDRYETDEDGNVYVYFKNQMPLSLVFLLHATDGDNIEALYLGADSLENYYTIENIDNAFPIVQAFVDNAGVKESVLMQSVVVDAELGTAAIRLDNMGDPVSIILNWDYSVLVSSKLCVDTTDPGEDGYIDESPQITIYGIPHSQLYTNSEGRSPGYITHLDVYRAEAEERPVCGLGGNLFTAYNANEVGSIWRMGLFYPDLRRRIDTGADQAVLHIGPAFISFSEADRRTAGVVAFSDSFANTARVLSVNYVSGDLVKYTLNTPNVRAYKYMYTADPVGNLEFGDTDVDINLIITDNDFLTIENVGYQEHNGVFPIVSATKNTNTIEVVVRNAAAASSDFDLATESGRAGVFTDTIFLDDECRFLPGDRIRSTAWGEEQYITAIVTSSLTEKALRVEGLYRLVDMPDGAVVVGERTSKIVPLRQLSGARTNASLVSNDIITYSGVSRDLRAKYINPKDDTDVKIIVNLGEALITMQNGEDTNWLSTGQSVMLLDDGVFRGEYVIEEVEDRLSFRIKVTDEANREASAKIHATSHTMQFVDGSGNPIAHGLDIDDPILFTQLGPNSSPALQRQTLYYVAEESFSATSFRLTTARNQLAIQISTGTEVAASVEYSNEVMLVGRNMQLDEALSWKDTITSTSHFNITRRWLPIEAPTTSFSQIPANYYRHLPSNLYDDQPFLRSTMVNDTMYFTNGDDAVQRFDGVNITRAGFFRWQPGVFLAADTSLPRIINPSYIIEDGDITALPANSNQFQVKKGEEYHFDVGQTIRYKRTDNTSGDTLESQGVITAIWSDDSNTKGHIEVDFGSEIIEEITNQIVDKSIQAVAVYGYYYRLNLVDANGNRIASAITGSEDARVTIKDTASIRHLLVRPPHLDNFDYAYITIEIYRTKANSVGPYYKVGSVIPEWDGGEEAYIEFIDTANDADLLATDQDPLTVLQGAELGTTWTGPLRAKYITSSANSLVLANFKDWPKLTVEPNKKPTAATVAASDFEGKIFTIRRSNLDTGTATLDGTRLSFECLADDADVISITAKSITDNTVTLTAANTFTAGQWAYLFYKDEIYDIPPVNPRLGGWYRVASATTTSFTVEVSDALKDSVAAVPFAASDVNSVIAASSASYIPLWLGVDKLYSTVGGLASVGLSSLSYLFLRLANGINSVQAVSGSTPWVVANAGGEYTRNNLTLETPYVTDATVEMVLPSVSSATFTVSGITYSEEAQVQATAKLYPSRLLVSYRNYPELFDSPTVVLDTNSESAIDINPADGQEITGVIPFFGDSAFGSAQKDGVLLVFKTASVYLVNINAKRAGQNPVQKIDTRGLGCTAPFSIAPTQRGIMFANQSGIYRITSNLDCEYIGRRLERLWQEKVDVTAIDNTVFGHYYPLGNQYKLSVPYLEDGEAYPKRTLVYNTTREYSSQTGSGSWTTYSNIPAIGWANMLNRPLFATPNGEVFTLRKTNTASDYRDGDEPIFARAVLRALDFGSGSIRKAVGTINIQFRPDNIVDTNPVIESAVDLVNSWEPLDLARVSRRKGTGNISSRATQQLSVIQFTADRRKGVYFQLRVTNDNIDEGLEVAGITMMVAGLSNTAIQQAKSTTG